MRRLYVAFLLAMPTFTWIGCHAYGMDVSIQNNGPVAVHNLEVDYPHASFGTPVIEPGNSFWYHIKPTEEGTISISFEPENGKTVRKQGPKVRPGVTAKLVLILQQDAGKAWQVQAEQWTPAH